ncbi:MAG: N-acetylmuramoyl-L-alanine amidase [Pseudomonadota bacterium]
MAKSSYHNNVVFPTHMVTDMLRTLRILITATALVLTALCAAPRPAAAQGLEAFTASLTAQAEDSLSLVVELSAEPKYALTLLANPPRLILDIARTNLPPLEPMGGLVKSVRQGALPDGTARLVLELHGPMTVVREFYFPPVGVSAGRLIIDLVAVVEGQGEPQVAEPAPQPAPTAAQPERVVVIDPGHGGIDPGAVNKNGVMEKAIVLDFAKRLAARLSQMSGVRAELTRTDDTFLSFQRRIRIARAFGADLFISVHADAAPQDFVRGATVYTVSERASDAEAAELAARENMADMVSGTIEPDVREDVSSILASLMRQETQALAVAFADQLVEVMSDAVIMNKNPHRQARFRVLQAYDIPSVLLELGYLTNATDAKALLNEEWQIRAAEAVARAVAQFLVGAERPAAGNG